MRTAAGVLEIIAGVINIFIAIGCLIASLFVPAFIEAWSEYFSYYDLTGVEAVVLVPLAILFAVAGILSLIGGIFALRKKLWGLALTGGILALLPTFIFGILSIVFVAVTKKEFDDAQINTLNVVD